MRYALSVAVLIFMSVGSTALAEDALVNGYYSSDDTYVRSQIRSSPDNHPRNNYRPSPSIAELMRPHSRDYASGNLSNKHDVDSDNYRRSRDFGRNSYGRSNTYGYPSPYDN